MASSQENDVAWTGRLESILDVDQKGMLTASAGLTEKEELMGLCGQRQRELEALGLAQHDALKIHTEQRYETFLSSQTLSSSRACTLEHSK